jgi:hypothetical protein
MNPGEMIETNNRALGSITSWLGEKAASINFGLLQVEVVIQEGQIKRIDKVVKEQIKI